MPPDPADPAVHLGLTLERLAATEPKVRAWVTVDAEGARATAASISATPGADNGVRGRTIAVKDVIDVKGLPTRAGSAAYHNVAPATRDATVVARLRAAGGIILGKAKTTEFAYIDPTDTANPANILHTPGGSSSGSAAAIAAGSADIALGTQTVGSVCRPAAYCGVAAFKPTTQSMPRSGLVPFARSFDTVGFFSRDIRTAVAAHRVCAWPGYDSPQRQPTGLQPHSLAGCRIGLLGDEYYQNLDPAVEAALFAAARAAADQGAILKPVHTRCDHGAVRELQRVVMFYEAAQSHSALLERPELLGPHWRSALSRGVLTSETDYTLACDGLADARRQLAQAFDDVDFLLLPPVRAPAPKGLESTGDAALIVSWTVFGSPLAVIPIGTSASGLPVAAMLAAYPWRDAALAEAAICLSDAIVAVPPEKLHRTKG
jgi:aspartyl-tRNA(Asn)/glutamyl-tRNA(Gln) amidotransferase subunit A